MEAYHRQTLAPTGASHALSVRLTRLHDTTSGPVISHLVTARASIVQVWEVREVEQAGKATATLHHLLTKRLHGFVTSLARVRTLASKVDGADRILISFQDAKMSLMEWTPSAHTLLPISLHTFEKLPQVAEGLAKAATDPASRLSVLLLPSNTGGDATLAILPFFQDEIDLESLGDTWGSDNVASLPYAPSHIFPLASLITASASYAGGAARSSTLNNNPAVAGAPPVRNIIDMVFLPGFNEPTLALLYAPELTWAGRLENVSSNCLVSLITLATGSAKPGSSATAGTTAVVIATSPSLPHSCLAVHPCPPDLGGALVITANGILHLEQGGKVIGTPSNTWFGKEWFGIGGRGSNPESTVREGLEGARIVFLANDKALVYCKTGTILQLTMQTSGRSVSSMKLEKVATGVSASCVERIRGSVGRFGEQGYVFVGSEVGESALMSWKVGKVSTGTAAVDDMEVDDFDDEDIYGTSRVKAPVVAAVKPTLQPLEPEKPLTLIPCDTIASYGSIRSMVVGLVNEESPTELVACTGAGVTAGLTVFHRTISPHKRRRYSIDNDRARGIWSLSTTLENGLPSQYFIVTDGKTSLCELGRLDETLFVKEDLIPGCDEPTIFASTALNGTLVVRVTPSQMFLLGSDNSLLHSIAFDSSFEVVRAVVSDPYITVVGKEGALLFVVTSSRLLEPLPLPARYLTSTITSITSFSDSTKSMPLIRAAAIRTAAPPTTAADADDDEDDLYATAPRRTIASDLSSSSKLVLEPSEELGATPTSDGTLAWNLLALTDDKGDLEILLLPSMEVVFSVECIALFPDVLEDGAIGDIPENVDPDDVKIDRIVCVGVGESVIRTHLLVLLTNGSFAAYEAFPSISAAHGTNRMSLGVRFVKVVARRLPIPLVRRARPGVDTSDDLPPPRREFIPFSHFGAYSGVFITGEDPFWLLASDHGPAHLYDYSEKNVHAFSPVVGEFKGAHFMTQSKTGRSLAELPQDICYDRELPYRRAPRDRVYSSFTFDIDSGLYVAGALFDTVFMNFDEEGQPVFVNDSPDLIEPQNYRSCLELILPGSWQAIHGYEFRPNEFISIVKSVSLATRSKASGRKEFIAVGTTVYRAEDLAGRGGIYIFEVIKVVPQPETPTHDHQLKLLFFEDTKSVVANLCDLDGYLVMAMGQKLYVRALEQDEVLLAVGFLDVGVHVTSLQSLKNFLLIGDALQSVTLVAFQADPYKLVLLGRDYRLSRTSSANFLVNDGRVSFVTGDLDGVVRLFEYDPSNVRSHAGQRLICHTEYRAGAEAGATLLFAKRQGTEEVKQNGIMFGGIDGSIYSLVPVREAVFKRLQLLQATMTKHVQHFAGLNPRGHRIVKNDSVSRAISKGILDGELLAEFEFLPLDLQVDLTAMIGTDPDTVLLNLRNLQW